MTVLQDLEGMKDRIASRLEELRPLVQEFEELQRAAQRLEIDTDSQATPRPKRASSPRRSRTSKPSAAKGGSTKPSAAKARSAKPSATKASSTRGRTAARKRPGRKPQRREQVLNLVKAHPGTTVPAIAKELGVDPTGLYRVIRDLEKDGSVRKSGMELTAVS